MMSVRQFSLIFFEQQIDQYFHFRRLHGHFGGEVRARHGHVASPGRHKKHHQEEEGQGLIIIPVSAAVSPVRLAVLAVVCIVSYRFCSE